MAEKMLPSELVEKWRRAAEHYHADAAEFGRRDDSVNAGRYQARAFTLEDCASDLEAALAYQQERPELEESE